MKWNDFLVIKANQYGLSSTEQEVFLCLFLNWEETKNTSESEIAKKLYKNVETIKKHKSAIYSHFVRGCDQLKEGGAGKFTILLEWLKSEFAAQSSDGDIALTEKRQRIEQLKKLIADLREYVLDLSEQSFELENQISIAKHIFEREFAGILAEIKSVETRIQHLQDCIDYKLLHPEASISDVEAALSEKNLQYAAELDEYLEQLKRSQEQGGLENATFLSDEEYQQSKSLLRKLVRQVHPDLLDKPGEDPMLGHTLQQLLDMRETGYNPAKLAEIEAKLATYVVESSVELSNDLEQESDADILNRLEQTASNLRLRKDQLRLEIKYAETSSYLQYWELIQDPNQREIYREKLGSEYQVKKAQEEKLSQEYTGLFISD